MNKASCLSLLSNAVLIWNTVQIEPHCRPAPCHRPRRLDEDLARVSPLLHAHITPNGSYFQSPRPQAAPATELAPVWPEGMLQQPCKGRRELANDQPDGVQRARSKAPDTHRREQLRTLNA